MLLRAALAVVCLLAAPAAAAAHDDDVRVQGDCGAGARSELRLKADDDVIEVELRVTGRRARERWRVTLVHERRVAWRGSARTRSGGRSFRVRRDLPNFDGVDEVSARAAGPRGVTCQATAVLSG